MWQEGVTPTNVDKSRQHLTIDDPTPLHAGVYLGNSQFNIEPPMSLLQSKKLLWDYSYKPGSRTSDTAKLDLVNFSDVTEPLRASGNDTSPAANATPPDNVKAWEYRMSGHAQDCVDRYLELSGMPETSLKKVSTPNLDDHQLAPTDFEAKGILAPTASKIVLKVLYLARVNRLDLLWTVNTLAREVSK